METTMIKSSRFQMSDKTKSIIFEVITYLFVLLFVYTAYSKFTTIDSFAIILGRSPLTGAFSTLIAWMIPITESLIAIALIIPITKRVGLYASLFLILSFTGFLVYGILSGSKLPCHCGGVINSFSWREHIWFNIAFIFLAIYGLILYKKT